MNRWLLFYIVFIALIIWTYEPKAQQPVFQQYHPQQRGLSRIVNTTPYYMLCNIRLSNGRTVLWELYGGQVTGWYYITGWSCR